MAGVLIRLNGSQIGEFLRSRQVRPPLESIARDVAAAAKSSAPVRTGVYKDSIRVESDTTDRAVERVVAHASHSLAVEAKTGNLKRALGRA